MPLAEAADRFRQANVIPVVSSPAVIRICDDKLATARFLAESGFSPAARSDARFFRSVPNGDMIGRASDLLPEGSPYFRNVASVPPMAASNRLSPRSWRTSRLRLAPMAERTASSRRRDAPRARSMLATFAQAMASTSPTAANSTALAAFT